MTDFRPWVVPTLLGPLVGSWGLFATLLFLLDPGSEGGRVVLAPFGFPVDTWVLAMGFASILGACLVFWLLVADIALLGLRLRRLPTGLRAWVTSLVSPLTLILVSAFAPPTESLLGVAAIVLCSFLATAFGLRFVGGLRP